MSAMSFQSTAAPRSRSGRGTATIRLTRRGRAVVLLGLLVLLLVAFGLGRASTADAGDAGRVARRHVVVRPGETLWGIARRVAPGTDPRATVARIERLNDLDAPIQAGQRLVLP